MQHVHIAYWYRFDREYHRDLWEGSLRPYAPTVEFGVYLQATELVREGVTHGDGTLYVAALTKAEYFRAT